jgi:hypothetical protein
MSYQSNSIQQALTTTPTVSILKVYEPRRSIVCCTKYKDRSNFQNILQSLELSEVQKQIITTRYLSILENFQRRSRNYSYVFFAGHFIVTVGSLFVPALLSIEKSDKIYTLAATNFSVQIYWVTFVISIFVTISNGILTLFKVDKKYYFLNTTLERLRSEGWQYFSLTGRYSGLLIKNKVPTHANQFIYFTHYIEKIKMKQVEEEYFKAEEKTAQTPSESKVNQQNSTNAELYPPSPDQPLALMSSMVPDPVKQAVNSLIKSQSNINTIITPELSRQYRRNSQIVRSDSVLNNDESVIVIPESKQSPTKEVIISEEEF